jgi:tight adherence protein C
MVLFLAVLLLASAIVLLRAALVKTQPDTGLQRSIASLEQMTSNPSSLTDELELPFADRVLEPLQARALGLGRRLTGGDKAERLRHKLDLAGNPPGWTVDRVLSGKVIGAVAGLVGGGVFSLMLGSPTVKIILIAGATVVGFFAPNLYLYQKGYDRTQKMQRALPDALDLLTISVEAGLGFDAALSQVARNTEGPLAAEFARVLQEMQIGLGRSSALRALGERSPMPDLRSFTSAMVQADAFGIPIGQVLRVQSSEIRVKKRQRAEEAAQKIPVKIMVPLVLFILPALFVAVLGPAIIAMMGMF